MMLLIAVIDEVHYARHRLGVRASCLFQRKERRPAA
jgi:hypothetical protein